MPLYLVKWDDGTSALVTSADQDELVETLDQLADPGAASWQEYDGPLWLEFPRIDEGLPDGDVHPEDLNLGPGTPALATEPGSEFAEAAFAALHPHVSALRERAFEEGRPVPRAELAAAIESDRSCALPGSMYGTDQGPEH